MIKHFFIKRVRVFFLYMIVPTLLIFIVMALILGTLIRDELERQSEYTLKIMETNIELVLDNAIRQHELMMASPRHLLSFRKLLSRDSFDYSDVVLLNSVKAVFNSIVDMHPYVDSIYVYLDGYDTFFASSANRVASLDGFFDVAWYEQYQTMDGSDVFKLEKRLIKEFHYAKAIETLSVYQRMTFGKGVIVVNIDLNKMAEITRTLVASSHETILLYNGDQELLFGDPSVLAQGSKKSHFVEKARVGQHYGLVYKSVIHPQAFWEKFSTFIGIAIAVLALNLFLVFLFAYLTTKRVFNQIQYMINVFDQAEKGHVVKQPKDVIKDEYDIIMNNIIFLFLRNNQMNVQLMDQKYRQEIAELAALQHQINPHFLFNALQTIDFEIRKQTPSVNEISEMVQHVSSILKYAMLTPTQLVSIEEELRYLKAYVSIEQYRFDDAFIVYYEIEPSLLNAQIFRLTLQPLVENSIQHGIRKKQGKGFIKVKIHCINDQIRIHIVDTGVGMSKETINNLYARLNDVTSENIGLTNVYRRLQLKFGQAVNLKIRSRVGVGTSIVFSFPWIKRHPQSSQLA